MTRNEHNSEDNSSRDIPKNDFAVLVDGDADVVAEVREIVHQRQTQVAGTFRIKLHLRVDRDQQLVLVLDSARDPRRIWSYLLLDQQLYRQNA